MPGSVGTQPLRRRPLGRTHTGFPAGIWLLPEDHAK